MCYRVDGANAAVRPLVPEHGGALRDGALLPPQMRPMPLRLREFVVTDVLGPGEKFKFTHHV
jgi:hypothetical protein